MAEALDLQFDVAEPFVDLYYPKRYKCYYGGRGGAKSWAFARALLQMGLKRDLRVLCTRELQISIKDSVHRLLADQIAGMGLSAFYEVLNGEIRCRLNKTIFLFKGIKHSISEIKSTEGVDVCWVEEAENVSEASWRTLIPTIRKEGSEIWVSFNPRLKTDATYQRFVVKPPTSDRAVIKKVGWRDNPWFPQVLKDEMEADKANDYEMYLHVWEGELRQYAENAIYAKQLREAREQGRILSIPIAKDVPVNTFWDLGKDDHTAIWLHQQVGPQNRFIGYYQNRLEELPHYAKWVLGHQYIWGHHYLPHDVEQDILGMAKTRKQQLEDMGIRPITVVPRVRHLNEGIEQTRRAFAGCWFEQDRCEQGLEALANYERKYDDENDTHSETPIHNWASNGADAFRQFGQGYQGSTNEWERFVKTETTGYSRRSRVVGVDRSWAE